MADYKDMFSGTLEKFTKKVKDVAESGTVRDLYESGANRAKSYAKTTKLTLEKNAVADELNRVYAEIGRLYYEQSKDSPEGFYTGLFSRVNELTAEIQEKESAINAIRAESEAVKSGSPEADSLDFDDIVSQFEADSTNPFRK